MGFNLNDWVVERKSEHIYDPNGDITSLIDYFWDKYTNGWKTNIKHDYTYDSNGYNILDIEYMADSEDWIASFKFESTFDSNGNITLYVAFQWIPDLIDWEVRYKYEYTFDSNGKLTSKSFYYLDSEDWINSYKDVYTYDSNGNNKLDINFQWDSNLNELVIGAKTFYYRGDNYTSVENAETINEIKIYPNPVSELLNIDLGERYREIFIRVLNAAGKEVINNSFKEQQLIGFELNNVPDGLYFINVKTEKSNATIKVVKKK